MTDTEIIDYLQRRMDVKWPAQYNSMDLAFGDLYVTLRHGDNLREQLINAIAKHAAGSVARALK